MENILVTGYRAHELGIYNSKHPGIPYIRQAITNRLIPLLEEGLQWVITPGQYGVDLWAIEAAIKLKSHYTNLKCSILTAYQNPEDQWNDDKKAYFQELMKEVDFYAPVSKSHYQGPWQFTARDDLLLRKTDGILLVYDEDAGDASPRFIKERALKKQAADGYRFISIGSEEIQAVADEENISQEYY